MNYIGKFISNFKDFYNDINAATLTGAIDVVVVRQEDGSYFTSPFHVRFGKMGVLRSKEKVVDIEVNGEPVDIHMKLGETGEAFFVQEMDDDEVVDSLLSTSPLYDSLFVGRQQEDDLKSQDSGFEAEDTTVNEKSNKYTENDEVGVIKKILKIIKTDKVDTETQTDLCPKSSPIDIVADSMECQLGSKLSETQSIVESESVESKGDFEDGCKIASRNIRRKRKRKNGRKNKIKSADQSSDESVTWEVPVVSSCDGFKQKNNCVVEEAGETGSKLSQCISMPLLEEVKVDDIWNKSMSRSMGPDFHPFSDTDISPPSSPGTSRPPTPIKSDTEYEVERQKLEFSDRSSQTDADQWQWEWGELPTPPSKSSVSRGGGLATSDYYSSSSLPTAASQPVNIPDSDAQRSMLGSMFSFMRATKKARHNPESEGIYLDDLNLDELDPEVKALYFPRNFKTSQNASSLGIPNVSADEDKESGNGSSLPHSPHSVECAITSVRPFFDSENEELHHSFCDHRLFNDIAISLCGRLMEHPDGDLPENLFLQSLITYDDLCENPQVLENPDLVIRFQGKYYNWSTAYPQIFSLVLFQRSLPLKVVDKLVEEHMPKKEIRKRTESRGYSWFSWRRTAQNDSMQQDATKENTEVEVTTSYTQTSPPPSPQKRVRASNPVACQDSSESEGDEDKKGGQERYKKSLRLSSQQISQLNLNDGSNEAVFSVTTAYQGTTRCKCHIFLWNFDDKIVVSDIDGTITKSDVLGHILPIIGKDWAQSGVAQLFTKVKNNGYHFLYLSARAIGQARITRDYLRSIKQGDLSLPDGPLLLNPTSLIQAFHREVIERKPEEFKISCLRDIQALFPANRNPFYAGYGNKINDVWAYRSVGIPISRIFTINHRGELKHELTQTFQSSYSNLSDIAHHMFPPVFLRESLQEFSSFQFWQLPLPDISLEINSLFSSVEKTK